MLTGLIFNNWHIKLGSLVLAFLFWFVLVSTVERINSFPNDIPIEVFNQPVQSEVVSITPSQVKIKIRASQNDLRLLKADNFNAYIDLSGLRPGTYELPVQVAPMERDIRVASVLPRLVTVVVDGVTNKTFVPSLVINGKAHPDYRYEEPKADLAQVRVEGPDSYVRMVASVEALIELSGEEKESKNFEAKLVPVTIAGKAVEEVEVTGKPPVVYLDIKSWVKEKSVPVELNKNNSNLTGKVEISPDSLTVKAVSSVLEQVESLSVEEFAEWELRRFGVLQRRVLVPEDVQISGSGVVDLRWVTGGR